MRLQSGQRSLDSDSIMAHKLLPYPIFDADGQMHEAKTKANLKNVIKVEVSSRDADASFLDFFYCAVGSALADICTVQYYLDRFCSYIHGRLKKTGVYLVFDR